MKAITCEKCNGNEFEIVDGKYMCKYCKTPYDLEKKIDALEESKNDDAPAEKGESGGKKLAKYLFDWLEIFAFSFMFVLVVFIFSFKIVTVDGTSMNRTLEDGENLIISNLFYQPKTGDIVIVSRDRFGQEPIVKRVIATEGQKVHIDYESWQVTVDGVLLDEPYVNFRPAEAMHKYGCPTDFIVGKDMVFVMGDNRNNSTDSRAQGVYDIVGEDYIYTGYTESDIMGKVLIRVLPLQKFGAVKPAA